MAAKKMKAMGNSYDPKPSFSLSNISSGAKSQIYDVSKPCVDPDDPVAVMRIENFACLAYAAVGSHGKARKHR